MCVWVCGWVCGCELVSPARGVSDPLNVTTAVPNSIDFVGRGVDGAPTPRDDPLLCNMCIYN